jgi:type IX secretion system PorP/SprF family membrane protein
MKDIYVKLTVLYTLFLTMQIKAQETLPIYFDYLSDNIFLVHPTAAGIGECGKIRLTARQQWSGVQDAPELQTLSFHAKASETSNAGYGFVFFNDKNGYHSQKAIQGSYAYHLSLGNPNVFKQLSFGLSFSLIQNEVDQTSFLNDPIINQIIESDFYYNADVGIAYHYKGYAFYFTAKNFFLSAKSSANSDLKSYRLRNYILGGSYFFGKEKKIQWEPSFMFQYKEQTDEKIVDINVKAYKKFTNNTQLWTALSYRTNFDGSVFGKSDFITPILGINYKNYMFSYTYTKQSASSVISNGNFHQISLGVNILCRKRRASACPNINGSF